MSPAGERRDTGPLSPPRDSPDYTLASASDGTHTLLAGDTVRTPIEPAAVLLDQDGAAGSDVVPLLREGEGYASNLRASSDGTGNQVADDGMPFSTIPRDFC